MNTVELIKLLKRQKFMQLRNEKALQREVSMYLHSKDVDHRREVIVGKNIFDLYFEDTKTVIEVKIKGSKRDLYLQCERYSLLPECETIIIMTTFAMGFPETLNNKPCYLINFSHALI